MTIAIIVGSSREKGNTEKVSSYLSEKIKAKIYSLSNYELKHFDYEFNNQDDDFPELINEILKHDIILLASPVYWYSPSAQMKVFMDRLSDLLTINKAAGREMRGKFAGVVATGSDLIPKSCFEEVFKHTFDYLGMQYIGMVYIPFNGDDLDLNVLTQKIETFDNLNSEIFSKERDYANS